jgi:hypothetical protein
LAAEDNSATWPVWTNVDWPAWIFSAWPLSKRFCGPTFPPNAVLPQAGWPRNFIAKSAEDYPAKNGNQAMSQSRFSALARLWGTAVEMIS